MNISHKPVFEDLGVNKATLLSREKHNARITVEVYEGSEKIGSVVVCSGPFEHVKDYFDGNISFAELGRRMGFKD